MEVEELDDTSDPKEDAPVDLEDDVMEVVVPSTDNQHEKFDQAVGKSCEALREMDRILKDLVSGLSLLLLFIHQMSDYRRLLLTFGSCTRDQGCTGKARASNLLR